ncbi:2,3-dihydro-2,3-dihydroxybenzoate dehydrogenase [Salmonella enterica subsp. enterica]|nr:2,3-dihydro-2,3-dihydroxybenzoate dehydrogenase [Salmonella enterica subsp. enterica]
MIGFDREFTQENYPFATEVMDVADAAQVAQVCQRVLQKTPRLDVLVNAAGILRMGATDALSVDDWQQTFAVNVAGHLTCFRRRWRSFAVSREGRLSP